MTIGAAYTTAGAYRSRINKRDARNDEAIDEDLLVVSRWLERKLHRYFNIDDAVTIRIYETQRIAGALPDGWAESENPWRYMRGYTDLEVEDIASTAGLVIKYDSARDGNFDVTLAATDYELLPRNAQTGPEPKPYTTIHLPSWSTVRVWPPATRVQVTALHGWPAVPSVIERAVIDIVGILRLESPRATKIVNRGLEETAEISPDAQRIVKELTFSYNKVPRVW